MIAASCYNGRESYEEYIPVDMSPLESKFGSQ